MIMCIRYVIIIVLYLYIIIIIFTIYHRGTLPLKFWSVYLKLSLSPKRTPPFMALYCTQCSPMTFLGTLNSRSTSVPLILSSIPPPKTTDNCNTIWKSWRVGNHMIQSLTLSSVSTFTRNRTWGSGIHSVTSKYSEYIQSNWRNRLRKSNTSYVPSRAARRPSYM